MQLDLVCASSLLRSFGRVCAAWSNAKTVPKSKEGPKTGRKVKGGRQNGFKIEGGDKDVLKIEGGSKNVLKIKGVRYAFRH